MDTKTQDDRYVPIHPVLAPVVKAWFEWGWEKYFGRRPAPEDFVIPRVVGPRRRQADGDHRSLDSFKDRMRTHREALGWWAGRSIHTLRHTFLPLAQNDGANRDVLLRATHKVPTDVVSQYTRVEWSRLCAEVVKLRVPRDTSLGVLGIWGVSDSILPAPLARQPGPGRKKLGRYVKEQRPVSRDGTFVTRPRRVKGESHATTSMVQCSTTPSAPF